MADAPASPESLHTDAPPTEPAPPDAVTLRILERNKSVPVMVWSKTYCMFCDRVLRLLASLEPRFECDVVQLNKHPDGHELHAALVKHTSCLTVPQVFVGGEFIGGCSETKALHEAGELQPKIAAAVEKLKEASQANPAAVDGAAAEAAAEKATAESSIAGETVGEATVVADSVAEDSVPADSVAGESVAVDSVNGDVSVADATASIMSDAATMGSVASAASLGSMSSVPIGEIAVGDGRPVAEGAESPTKVPKLSPPSDPDMTDAATAQAVRAGAGDLSTPNRSDVNSSTADVAAPAKGAADEPDVDMEESTQQTSTGTGTSTTPVTTAVGDEITSEFSGKEGSG